MNNLANLSNLRITRRYIKEAIDRKHNEWLEFCSVDGFCFETADLMSETIAKLFDQLDQCDRDIRIAKEQLIEEAL